MFLRELYKKYFYTLIFLFIHSVVFSNEIEEHIKSGDAFFAKGEKTEAATHYNKAAYLLRNSNRKEESINYYEKVLSINQEVKNQHGVILTRDNLSMLYTEVENYTKAIEYLKVNLAYYKSQGNTKQIISLKSNIADSYKESGQYDIATTTILETIDQAREFGDLKLLKRCYGIGLDIFKAQGNEEKTVEYFGLYAAIDKKIKENQMDEVKVEAQKEVTQAQSEKKLTQVELEKTQTSLKKVEEVTLEQKLQIENNELKIKEQQAQLELEQVKRRLYATGFIIVGAFATILIFLIIWLSRLIRNLKLAKEEISIQARKLEIQNKEITASIRYANTIQSAILPSVAQIEKVFDPFIIYMPKDIVSGDFYWYSMQETEFGESHFISVLDCTGHGVPGAFMSMIGSQILNEIVIEKNIHAPASILEELNQTIHESLRQSETDNNDGMDVAFCRIEKENDEYTITYSGARRPLYYHKGGEAIAFMKGDRKSIGGYKAARQKNKFTEKILKLNTNDKIYMFSDGMTDQNNNERKKYGRQRLETLLEATKNEHIKKQEEDILIDFKSFMGDEEQRDDITLIGIKLP